ncbi:MULTISPECIES: sigma-54-dependent Fis family transcriptional regulator [Sporomusa]|jgi:transcriptional regulator with PAS, ATPase and Fis domain|uniref:Limonene hydroxylase n=2 Tax=Sporomusa TaxID=2375 RepID=A0ABP2C2M0_9FIRM|nr:MULTISPECIES: sigma 54-interacting transcriptional regulator [Sporomusa]OLS57345.1 limonene hydroxylase [Sporomusa sphaeroides DSM 2875]CVK18097.1 Limonene hydroxylase [Sporomusa sphaeroides DSM 2875]SCM81326.1 Sigma-54-dependent transcriptional regulator [uncultured Sporomusa sp.]HML33687.1 sigma 54-interacting transcriptional regulator [Sporomusa sphaeroides]
MLKKYGSDIIDLKSIQDYIQRVADAFAAVLDYEVAVVGEYLEVLAGTGKYKDQIGTVYGSGTINYQLRRTQKSFLLYDPLKCRLCQNCSLRKNCKVLAGLLYPIKLGTKFAGSISLYAFDDTQKENLLKDSAKLETFLQHLVELISGKLNERALYKQSKKTVEQFDTLINSIREGIVAVDYHGKITHVNRSATDLLMVPANLLNGYMIEEVFAGISMGRLLKMTKPYIEQDIFYKYGQQTLHFMSTITEVKYGEAINGFVFSFRSIGEMRKLAGRFIHAERKYTFDGILGQSEEISSIKKKMCRVAATDSTVLITGESGTGKELFARAIHHESLRKKGPFIAVNCGAIPENLLESELFGYEEGAFTGARRSGKPGKFELANGGTIFLDEIGDMPLHLQVKLLRVLQEYTIERVGGTKPLVIDARIIAATNRNLEEMIQTNQFRSDLYYRLSVIPFRIPPLRERMEDLELLIHCFIQKYNLILGKRIKGYTKDALARMFEYSWPGNVRELENAIEYSANVCPDSLINANYLPDRIIKHITALQPSQPQESVQSIADLEKKAIVEALKRYGTSNHAKENIAKYLGMSRSTLYRKIKEMGINIQ